MNMFAVIAAAPATLATPAIAVSWERVTAGDPGFAECVAKFQRAEAAQMAHYESVVEPAERAYFEACAAVPHHTTKTSFGDLFDDNAKRIRFTTADRMHCYIAREHGAKVVFDDSEFGACATELLGAIKERDAQLEVIERQYREVTDQAKPFIAATSEALSAVETYPVRTLTDLIKKIEIYADTDGEHPSDMLLADLRRIEGEA